MKTLQMLAGKPNEIVMEREFDAPRRLVIKAMTTPELIKRWHGGDHTLVVSAEHDLRVGGKYRHVFQVPDGPRFSFSGEYLEVTDDCLVFTERMDDNPGTAVNTYTFSEHDGKTTVRMVMAFESEDIRDSVIRTGMAEGAESSYDKLSNLLAAHSGLEPERR